MDHKSQYFRGKIWDQSSQINLPVKGQGKIWDPISTKNSDDTSAHPALSTISQINNRIFLSGIFPMDDNYKLIKDLKIKYILSCVDRSSVSEIHDKLLIDNPDLIILYLPYRDDNYQNLWKTNKNYIDIIKYIKSLEDHDKLRQQLILYNNKPMIEIGYHFINQAISSGNNILIHCMAGISRSVSTLIYFFMKKYYISFDEAMNFIKNKREIASPNYSFKTQLRHYQNKREKLSEEDVESILSFGFYEYRSRVIPSQSREG